MIRLQKLGEYFANAYLIIILIIFPLFMKNGYEKIGETKFVFWKYITISVVIIFAFLLLLQFLCQKRKDIYLFNEKNFSVTDVCFIFYGCSIILSYSVSAYKETALWGSNGWFMGCLTHLLLIAVYFGISRLWKYQDMIWITVLLGSVIVFLLGIMNRFSIYPLPVQQSQPDFISTLGNINWFCGYWSVLWPVGVCIFIFSNALWVRLVSGIYLIIAGVTGVIQGSSSAFLSIFMVYYLLFLICRKKRQWIKHYLWSGILWCISCQLVRLLRLFFPDRYNYATDNLCGWITGNSATIYIGILLGAGYLVLYLMERGDRVKIYEILKSALMQKIIIGIPIILLLIYLVIAGLNTKLEQGIWGLKGNELFLLNGKWGSTRGITWSAGLQIFSELSLAEKLLGVGPDCFAEYAYGNQELSRMLSQEFGSLRLTNAHNEWITALVNLGIVGLCSYMGIFFSVLIKYLRWGNQNQRFFIPVLCAVSYGIHNIVSFAQILNLPFLILILGMSECLWREIKSTIPEKLKSSKTILCDAPSGTRTLDK